MKPKIMIGLWLVLGMLVATRHVGAWQSEGHKTITALAIELAAPHVPPFLSEEAGLAIHCSCDPDVFREYRGSQLRDQEAAEHYFDWELLDGEDPPALRSEFVAACALRKVKPADVGCLPYAVTEWTQRLTMAMVEHRRWPDNPHIRVKACVYMGILSHYAADLCMPLHVTLHFDGRPDADGNAVRTGIHSKIDALPGKLRDERAALLAGLESGELEDVMTGVVARMKGSRDLIDRVYALESRLPGVADPLPDDPDVLAFTRERTRAAAAFLATLYRTAWRDSGSIKPPAWLDRSLEAGAK